MTPIDFIKENKLEWQPSFCRNINSTLFGYRGALIIEEGKKLSETKIMPPKAQAKQVIMISENDKIKFFAAELETFLTANITLIENWVASGGKLLLNAAPNEGDGMSFGFDGTTFQGHEP